MPAPTKPKAKVKRSITDKFFTQREQRDKRLSDDFVSRVLGGAKQKKRVSEKTKVKPRSRKI